MDRRDEENLSATAHISLELVLRNGTHVFVQDGKFCVSRNHAQQLIFDNFVKFENEGCPQLTDGQWEQFKNECKIGYNENIAETIQLFGLCRWGWPFQIVFFSESGSFRRSVFFIPASACQDFAHFSYGMLADRIWTEWCHWLEEEGWAEQNIALTPFRFASLDERAAQGICEVSSAECMYAGEEGLGYSPNHTFIARHQVWELFFADGDPYERAQNDDDEEEEEDFFRHEPFDVAQAFRQSIERD